MREDNFNLDLFNKMNITSISGLITTPNGEPISRAFVTGTNSKTGETATATADMMGNYTLENLVAGSYYVQFFANGFSPEYLGKSFVWEGVKPKDAIGIISGADIVLNPVHRNGGKCEVCGLVKDKIGNPLPAAVVMLKDENDTVRGYALTDSYGLYVIDGIDCGEYKVTATKTGYASQSENILMNFNLGKQIKEFSLELSLTNLEKCGVPVVPGKVYLGNNNPSPLTTTTKINFSIPEDAFVNLSIKDSSGRLIKELVNDELTTGQYFVSWNGIDFLGKKVKPGVYSYHLSACDVELEKQIIVLNKQ
ncbi:MAG: carboxypeptidase regulatory-like domain-containing protein [bacterium]